MEPKNLVILASGEGSNFEAIVTAAQRGELSGKIVGILSNRERAPVLTRAKRLKIPAKVLQAQNFSSSDDWDRAMLRQLEEWRADWLALAGFTGLIGAAVLARFPSRIVNSHPSLLPKYGGKGMYGKHVHTAVIQGGEKESGVTIHLLNERFDEGPIVAQKRIPVQADDTAQTLAERLQTVERAFYPAVLEELLTGRIKSR